MSSNPHDNHLEKKPEGNSVPLEKKISKFEKFTSGVFRKFLILFLITYLFPECSSFGPKNAQSSLIIVHMTIVKNEMILDELIDPRFQKVL